MEHSFYPKIFDPRDFPSYLPKLNDLYDGLFTGGKGFRAKLSTTVCQSLNAPKDIQQLLAQSIEFIHNASLLHDDLVDRSPTRRGKTSAWLEYSPEYAVLAGDYLLARVMVNLSGHSNIQTVQYTSRMISDLLEGEWLQDSLVGDFGLTLEQLDRVHNLKTASLMKWCLVAPFLAQRHTEPRLIHVLEELGTLLGLLFQRSDDLLDYDVRNGEGKAILGDIKSGYLNSFGCFALDGLSLWKRQKFRQIKDMEEFYEAIGGQSEFENKVKNFDQMNLKLFSLYDHYIAELGTLTEKISPNLSAQLKPLAKYLYYRST